MKIAARIIYIEGGVQAWASLAGLAIVGRGPTVREAVAALIHEIERAQSEGAWFMEIEVPDRPLPEPGAPCPRCACSRPFGYAYSCASDKCGGMNLGNHRCDCWCHSESLRLRAESVRKV